MTDEAVVHSDGPPAGMGAPIPGPSAFGRDRTRTFRLAWTLAVTDFRLRFFDSMLGYLWTLMRPLLMFGVLYAVFSLLLELGGAARFQPVAMLLGIVMFQFLAEATQLGVRSLLQREALIRKVDFPLIVVPLASTLTACFSLLLNLVPVTVFLLIAGGRPRLSWVAVPVLLVVLALFAFGLVCGLSALFVRYRDVEPVWDVVMQALFYATPIIYPVQAVIDAERVPRWLVDVVGSNPLAALIQEVRHVFVDPSHLSALQVLQHDWVIVVPIAIVVGVLVAGLAIFSRLAPTTAERL